MKKLLLLGTVLTAGVFSLNSQIVINEIMYNGPESGTDTTEFIELYNAGSSTEYLTGGSFSAGVTHTFGVDSIVAGGYYVIAYDSASFFTTFGFYPNAEWTTGGLSNGGESIVLKDGSGNTLDSLVYDDAAPWSALPDGDGYTLQLCDPLTDNTDGANWGVSTDSAGFGADTIFGTPGAVNVCIAVAGPTYDLISIDSANNTDANGVAVILGSTVELRGVVNCIDFAESTGYEFFLANGQQQGISVRAFTDVDSYFVTAGDSLHIKGEIDQYNGLLQIFPDSIEIATTGNTTQLATVVTALDETTESRYVTLQNVHIVNTADWSTGGSFNVQVTDGGSDTSTVRIDEAANFGGMPAPTGTFNISGWGGQFDNNGTPLDSGYQLLPCSPNDLIPVTTAIEKLDGVVITMYPNPTTGLVNLFSDKEITSVSIYNSLGTLVYSSQVSNSKVTLDLNNLDNGTYFTVLSGVDFQLTKSLVITK